MPDRRPLATGTEAAERQALDQEQAQQKADQTAQKAKDAPIVTAGPDGAPVAGERRSGGLTGKRGSGCEQSFHA